METNNEKLQIQNEKLRTKMGKNTNKIEEIVRSKAEKMRTNRRYTYTFTCRVILKNLFRFSVD